MPQGFGFEVERSNDFYVFTKHPEICPDCGEEAVIPTDWEEITKGFWQVDRLCLKCVKPVNSTFLNEQEIADYDDKLDQIQIRVMLERSKLGTQEVQGIDAGPDALEETG